MSEFVKKTFSALWRFIFANFICIFALLIVSTLCTALLTKEIGYEAYGTIEGSEETVHLYTYYNEDGVDTQKAEYEEQGYTVSVSDIRSDMTKAETILMHVICQIVCICVTAYFLYPLLWHLGNKDYNRVHFGRIKEDKLRGAKIGLATLIPYFVLYLVLVVFALGAYKSFPLVIYRFVNATFFSLLIGIFGSAATAGDLGIIRMLLTILPFAFIPLITGAAYLLGYKDISITEKLIYKNKKDRKK